MRDLVENKNHQFQLILQSFGFKHGVPLDTDFTFDVRCLPNPFYEDELKQLSGSDSQVADYLSRSADTLKLIGDIHRFVDNWLPLFITEGRVTLAISIGCTGGQHRSVYVVEQLEEKFKQNYRTLMRHRDIS